MSSLKTYKEEIFEREELEKIEKKGLLKVLKKVKLPKQVLKADLYTQKSTKKGNFLRKILKKGFKKVFSLKKVLKKNITQKAAQKSSCFCNIFVLQGQFKFHTQLMPWSGVSSSFSKGKIMLLFKVILF